MMRSCILLGFLCFLSGAGGLALTGCAGATEDGEAGSSALTSGDPRYDAVVAGGTRVDTSTVHSVSQSASTHLIGFVSGARSVDVEDRVLSFTGWTEIRGPNGDEPFRKAVVASDTTASGVRTFAVDLTLDKGVSLRVEGTAKPGPRGIEVRMTNTTAYKHWLLGTILEAGALHIGFDIVPYGGGVIVDATMAAKLTKLEDKAAAMTGAVSLVFAWIEAGLKK